MAKILISPSKYLQGAGEMKNIGTYAAKCGKKALVLISQGGYRRIGAMIEESFAGSDCDVVFDYFNGECCESEINRLVAIVKEKGCDLVIGVGGGKIFDTAKAVAYYAEKPVFICPTIASTDAPCSAAAERTGSRPAQHGGLQRIKGALRADDSGIKRSLPGASDGSAGKKDPSKEYGIL